MSPESVREYAEVMRKRYRAAATRAERTALLDELCTTTGYHRKAAVRCLRSGEAGAVHRGRGRPPTYSAAAVGALVELWEASDRLCSKRLAAVLPDLVAALERHGELHLDPVVRTAVLAMSPATIDRRLAPVRRKLGHRPYTQTASATALKALVPVRTFGEWANVKPGSCQADLVAHCGETTAGTY